MKTKYWFKKYRSMRKYDRMIRFAKKQVPTDIPDEDLMEDHTGYNWHADSCLYCKEIDDPFGSCKCCALGVGLASQRHCCNGLWKYMNDAKTWEEWIRYAVEVRFYIQENG